MLFQTNFSHSNYLSNYDLITKYNLTSTHLTPKIKNITIDFSLASFLKAYDFNKLSTNDKEIQIKAFLFFYFLNGSIPFINNKVISSIKGLDKMPESNSALKIKISSSSLINQFLISFFVENWSRVIKEELKPLSKIVPVTSLPLLFNLKLSCPASSLFEADTFLTNTITSINSKEFFISLNFLIEKSTKLNSINSLSLIKNLPLFWING